MATHRPCGLDDPTLGQANLLLVRGSLALRGFSSVSLVRLFREAR
jgi:hypothetical protein